MTDQEKFTRPTTIQDMQERMKAFSTTEGWQKGLDYKPDPTDVFIVTPPKCGITWMQQIVQLMRAYGLEQNPVDQYGTRHRYRHLRTAGRSSARV